MEKIFKENLVENKPGEKRISCNSSPKLKGKDIVSLIGLIGFSVWLVMSGQCGKIADRESAWRQEIEEAKKHSDTIGTYRKNMEEKWDNLLVDK